MHLNIFTKIRRNMKIFFCRHYYIHYPNTDISLCVKCKKEIPFTPENRNNYKI